MSTDDAVLIVEDDTEIREALRDLLTEHGYRVLEAANGLEALSLVERLPEPPCVVLLDLMMPVMTGWELLEKWETQGGVEPHRVCIISAFADQAPATVHHVFGK